MQKLLTLLLLAASFAAAQTTTNWVMQSPANCHSNFTHPTSFYQFSCNIPFLKDNGDGTFGPDSGEMIGTNIFNFNPVGFDIADAGNPPQYISRKSKVLQDIAPTATSPGQATWQWQVQTQDGLYHVGVLTMQWGLGGCTRSGCLVIVHEAQTTVDQSTVAILD